MTVVFKYILPPFAGAAIGWLTNYVAIKLLFRPHHPVRFMGFTFQGLIPKRRREIARSIATTIEKELLSSKDLAAALDGIDLKEEVERTVEEVIDHRFRSEKVKKIPLIGLVSDNLLYHVKYLVSKEILLQIDRRKQDMGRKFAEKLNVKDILASRIDRLDVKRFEGLLTEFISRELRHIEWLGGIMGFLIGLAQTGIFYFFG